MADILTQEKQYVVRLTEKEMQTLGYSLARYFNICTAEKRPIPVEHAAILSSLLDKMKDACSKGLLLI